MLCYMILGPCILKIANEPLPMADSEREGTGACTKEDEFVESTPTLAVYIGPTTKQPAPGAACANATRASLAFSRAIPAMVIPVYRVQQLTTLSMYQHFCCINIFAVSSGLQYIHFYNNILT